MPTSAAFRLLGTNATGALERAMALSPDEIVAIVERAGLRGRGGAGFPLAQKLRAVRTAAAMGGGPAYVVANAYDADPDSPLARTLLDRSVDLVIAGILIAARAVGATTAYLYLHPEAAAARATSEKAVAAHADRLGGLALETALGPGGFMGGEESAVLAVLEGRRAMARQRPPWPAEQGLRLRPTLVSSAETLAALPLIVRDGPDAFGAGGTARGTKLVSVTGAVAEPGVYEVALGTTLGEVVQAAGGVTHALKGLHVGGPTGGILNSTRTSVRLDFEDLVAAGTHLGSAQIRAIPEGTCIVGEAARLFAYLAKETCALCVPCRVGTKRVGGILESISSGLGREDDIAWLGELADHLRDFSLCGFGITSASIVRTTVSEFPDDYRAHIVERRCPEGTCAPTRSRRYETMAQP